MKRAEEVTFGGSGFERAAHLRADAAGLRALYAAPTTQVLPMWRGKPLCNKDRPASLAWLASDHRVFDGIDAAPIFLGQNDEGAKFAKDISAWEPDDDLSTVGAFLDLSEQWHPEAAEGQFFLELRRIMTWLSPEDAELAATSKALIEWHNTHQFCSRCGKKTQISQGGWQMDCPDCGRHHFPRTDPVVIMLITHGNSVLMGRSHGWPEGMYSLLAGFIEPGETMEAAVRRETFEEAGVKVGQVEYLSSQPWPFPGSLMFGCRGDALTTQINIDPNELDDAKWMTREQMLAVMAGEDLSVLPARKGAIAHFLISHWLSDTLD